MDKDKLTYLFRGRNLLLVLETVLIIVLSIWGLGIVYYSLNAGVPGLIVFLLLVIAVFMFRKAHSSIWRVYETLLLLLLLFYFLQPASNDHTWQAPWLKAPICTIEGKMLKVQHVRDFSYRTENDYDVHYRDESYDLSKLTTLDFAVSHWDDNEAIAHTMLSFGFSDGKHLVISVETRLRVGQEQNSIAGLFNQYNFHIIMATEEDILALRTNYRHEALYLYRFYVTPDKLRILLTDLAIRANRLNSSPEFYNTLTHNCTTGLLPSLKKINPSAAYSTNILINGYLDKWAFQKGKLVHRSGETFLHLKARSLVPANISKDNRSTYSSAIRTAIGMSES